MIDEYMWKNVCVLNVFIHMRRWTHICIYAHACWWENNFYSVDVHSHENGGLHQSDYRYCLGNFLLSSLIFLESVLLVIFMWDSNLQSPSTLISPLSTALPFYLLSSWSWSLWISYHLPTILLIALIQAVITTFLG